MEKWPYRQFLSDFGRLWRQGQHVLISGPTGSGKTFVAEDIKELRTYVVIIASKRSDESLDKYRGFHRIAHWPPLYDQKRVIFWKKPRDIEDLKSMRTEIFRVLADIFIVGGWTVYFDDIAFLSGTLHLDAQLRMMYTQVRSNHTSLVASVQRPYRVPVEVVSQSSYVLLFPTHDDEDIKRIAHETGQQVSRLKYQVGLLQEHDFLFLQHGKDPIHIEKRPKGGEHHARPSRAA